MNNKTFLKAIGSLHDIEAYALANMAETNMPYDLHSSGAKFLTGIRDAVAEQLEYYIDDYADVDSLSDFVDGVRDKEEFEHGIADGAPSIWNYERMRQLTDLAAWDEDVSDYGDSPDIITAAGYALYNVAGRLIEALLQEVSDFEDDEEYSEDSEDDE